MSLPYIKPAYDGIAVPRSTDKIEYSYRDVEEYGRQCWNAAIEAALDVYYDYDGGDDLQDNTDVAIRALTLDTVSTPE